MPVATRGWDQANKVNGRKRHIAAGTAGLVLAVVVTAASTQDREAAALESAPRVPWREAHLG